MESTNSDYFRHKVEVASPVERVVMLYDGALRYMDLSLANLKEGQFESFTMTNIRTQNILSELRSSLDHERGGEVSSRLSAIYTYLLGRLVDSNRRRGPEGIEEASRLMRELKDGWEQIVASEANASAEPLTVA
jgi:flagellar protein FliS